ncbi:hypothetical protein D3C71_1278140 [compost metagenome]
MHAGHEHHAGGNDPPRNHDPRDPDPGPYLVQDDVAGNLENEIADEENAGAQPIHRFAELKLLQHLQLGEPHIDAVQIGHDIADHQQRYQPPAHLAIDAVLLTRRDRRRDPGGHRVFHQCLHSSSGIGRLTAGVVAVRPSQTGDDMTAHQA